jgi:hypothetical protein
MSKRLLIIPYLISAVFGSAGVHAGAQIYEPLSASVQSRMTKAISDVAPDSISYGNTAEINNWLRAMDRRLQKKLPDADSRQDFLHALHYEATRAGLDPEMVLEIGRAHV